MAQNMIADGWSLDSPDLRDQASFREFKKLILRILSASPDPLSYFGIRRKLIEAGCEPDSYVMQLALEELENDSKVDVDRSCVNITRFSAGGIRRPINPPGEWTGRVCQDKRR